MRTLKSNWYVVGRFHERDDAGTVLRTVPLLYELGSEGRARRAADRVAAAGATVDAVLSDDDLVRAAGRAAHGFVRAWRNDIGHEIHETFDGPGHEVDVDQAFADCRKVNDIEDTLMRRGETDRSIVHAVSVIVDQAVRVRG